MNVSCDIIRDILPLYAEDMVSPATRELVDDHLCGCDSCTKELGELKKKEPVPVDNDTAPMKKLGKSIKKQNLITICAVLLTVVSLITSIIVFMQAPIYLSYDQAVEGVELREDGSLAIDYARGIISQSGIASRDTGVGTINSAQTNRYAWLTAKREDKKLAAMTPEELDAEICRRYLVDEVTPELRDRFNGVDVLWCYTNGEGDLYAHRSEDGLYVNRSKELSESTKEYLGWDTYALTSHDYDLWFYNPDGGLTLLWNGGSGAFPEAEAAILADHDTLVYQAVFAVCLVLTVLGIAGVILLRKSAWKEIPARLAILSGSAVAAFLLITGGDFSDPMGARFSGEVHNFFITWVLLALTAGCWYYLHSLKKRDKAI